MSHQLPCCENDSRFVIDYDVGITTTTYLVCTECLEKPCFASDIKNKKEIDSNFGQNEPIAVTNTNLDGRHST